MENKNIMIDSYSNFESASAQMKAMRVTIGKYKLYFSYETLIGFYDGHTYFISDGDEGRSEGWGNGNTTAGHKYMIGTWTHREYVSPNLLKLLVFKTILKKDMRWVESELGLTKVHRN